MPLLQSGLRRTHENVESGVSRANQHRSGADRGTVGALDHTCRGISPFVRSILQIERPPHGEYLAHLAHGRYREQIQRFEGIGSEAHRC